MPYMIAVSLEMSDEPKISHTKRKKNNKTLSENDTEMWGTQFVPRYCFVCPSLSLGREVRFSIISETLKVITCT